MTIDSEALVAILEAHKDTAYRAEALARYLGLDHTSMAVQANIGRALYGHSKVHAFGGGMFAHADFFRGPAFIEETPVSRAQIEREIQDWRAAHVIRPAPTYH